MADDENRVGYKRPPKASQFQPGRSGNPSGKPKGLRSVATELRDILAEEITVPSGNELKRITKQRALASALVTAAIEGDLRATAIVLNHLSRSGGDAIEEPIDFSPLERHHKRNP